MCIVRLSDEIAVNTAASSELLAAKGGHRVP